MAGFPKFLKMAQELQDHVWDQALLAEVESRFILVQRVSMKVLPHKNSTRSAILGVDRQVRAYALKFYDIKLDVWTFDASVDFGHEFDLFLRFPRGLEVEIQRGMDPRAMAHGAYGSEALRKFRECFWEYRFRDDLHQSVLSNLMRAPSRTLGSKKKGAVYLNSQLDKFTLSGNVQPIQPSTRIWNVDVCIETFMRRRERLIRGRTRGLNDYNPRHMTVRIPRQAMERIRKVVSTYLYNLHNGLEPEHVCGPAHMQERQWKLGSFRGANQLYTANMNRIPANNLKFEESQRLVEWKRTEPPAALPFICACADAEAEQNEKRSSIEVASPDDEVS
ncbi:hypothetical protein PG996_003163 [Apiospora saccharicola]|uniref:Uncharacterized protein n=1 Tax=Apiospora saccharicola TaxID=335842 RepID=A0ABR1W0I7_9PEZI